MDEMDEKRDAAVHEMGCKSGNVVVYEEMMSR
jgi:hypothetical protein